MLAAGLFGCGMGGGGSAGGVGTSGAMRVGVSGWALRGSGTGTGLSGSQGSPSPPWLLATESPELASRVARRSRVSRYTAGSCTATPLELNKVSSRFHVSMMKIRKFEISVPSARYMLRRGSRISAIKCENR